VAVFWAIAPCGLASEVLAASVIRAMMMKAASASETSENFYQTTRRNISEDVFILAAVRT
jgi:hypothetical protein